VVRECWPQPGKADARGLLLILSAVLLPSLSFFLAQTSESLVRMCAEECRGQIGQAGKSGS
jgi:hypothetical protein